MKHDDERSWLEYMHAWLLLLAVFAGGFVAGAAFDAWLVMEVLDVR